MLKPPGYKKINFIAIIDFTYVIIKKQLLRKKIKQSWLIISYY